MDLKESLERLSQLNKWHSDEEYNKILKDALTKIKTKLTLEEIEILLKAAEAECWYNGEGGATCDHCHNDECVFRVFQNNHD